MNNPFLIKVRILIQSPEGESDLNREVIIPITSIAYFEQRGITNINTNDYDVILKGDISLNPMDQKNYKSGYSSIVTKINP